MSCSNLALDLIEGLIGHPGEERIKKLFPTHGFPLKTLREWRGTLNTKNLGFIDILIKSI